MQRKFIVIVVLALLLIGGIFLFNKDRQVTLATDHKNAEYMIDGARVKLNGGIAEQETAPGSASKIITRYFGNELVTDLNNDGRDDVVFLLTQETGGSGTFFYAVSALNTEQGYLGSDGYLLGDRIAPQTTELSRNPQHKNVVVINYAGRKAGEPMTTQPSEGKSAYLKLDTESMQWGVVEPDFEGEADPSRMTLGMKKWVWQSALYNDGREVRPKKTDIFTLSFDSKGNFSATTDCNGVGGSYNASGDKLTFGNMMSTLMYCEGSQESEFTELLSNVSNYHFTSKGELILELKFDSGSVVFK
ncbi:MAG: META domain-containing protein [Patescibacteria group bacterium]